jgi:hypothetical protein
MEALLKLEGVRPKRPIRRANRDDEEEEDVLVLPPLVAIARDWDSEVEGRCGVRILSASAGASL